MPMERDRTLEDAMIADLVNTASKNIGAQRSAGAGMIQNPNDKIVLLLGIVALRLGDIYEHLHPQVNDNAPEGLGGSD